MIKVLIVSRSPWDNSNSFGNTFSNLFGGMQDVEIYNLCCQDGVNSNSIVRKAYQMTDRTVLRSMLGRPAGHVMLHEDSEKEQPQALSSIMPRRRLTIFYIIRDFIWKFGRWWNRDIKSFLEEVNPDIIYLPLYASWYMCDVQRKIVDYCQVPVVGHISDDLYNYPPHCLKQPLAYLYRVNVRRKIRQLIAKCSYVEVFAENMARDYSRIFKKPFYVIGKGIDTSAIDDVAVSSIEDGVISYVYTGNIGNGRYKELAKLAKALDKEYDNNKAELRIYTQSMIEKDMKQSFEGCKSLKLCGSVSSDEVRRVQQKADVLVHVESFSDQSIFETKMSFSTKIIDYMLAGKIIFAIGPSVVNSIETLRTHKLAITACSDEEIEQNVRDINEHMVNEEGLQLSVKKYLKENRNIHVIQSGMLKRMSDIIQMRK